MSNADRFVNRHKSRYGKGRPPAGAVRQPPQGGGPINHQDELMKVAMQSDLSRLKRIQSRTKKIELKASELLPRYQSYLKGLIAENRAGPAEVILRNLVWAMDAAQVDWALELGTYATAHGIATSEGFRRDIKNVFVGDMASLALQQQKEKLAVAWIVDIQKQSKDWDLVDQIRADLYKACGAELETIEPEAALDLLKKAIKLDPRCRVTRQINRLEKRLSGEA